MLHVTYFNVLSATLLLGIASGIQSAHEEFVRDEHEASRERPLHSHDRFIRKERSHQAGLLTQRRDNTQPSPTRTDEKKTASLKNAAHSSQTVHSPRSFSEVSHKTHVNTQRFRPEIVSYDDKECTHEIVGEGWYLPTNVKVKDRECMWVSLRAEEADKDLALENRSEVSMEWVCAESGETMKLIAHKNSKDCSGGVDDRFLVTVNKIDYNSLQKGDCTQAFNDAADQTVYVKIMSHDKVAAWPACMKDWTYIYYGIAAGGVAFLMALIWCYCLRRSYNRRKKKKEEQEWLKGLAKGKGKMGKDKGGMPPGGKGAPAGKGAPMMGKGPMGKDKGGKWGPPEEEQKQPGPLEIGVTIVSASNLKSADVTGSSDPFVICHIHGREQKMKFKTPVVKENLNPKWEHSDKFKGFEEGEMLEFMVYDDDMGGAKKDFLGKAKLKYSDIFPNGYDGTLKMEECGDAKESKLKVKVEILKFMEKKEKKEKK